MNERLPCIFSLVNYVYEFDHYMLLMSSIPQKQVLFAFDHQEAGLARQIASFSNKNVSCGSENVQTQLNAPLTIKYFGLNETAQGNGVLFRP